MPSDSKLYALWRAKGAQKNVFGVPFRCDSEVSGESENEARVLDGSTVFKVLGHQKSEKTSTLFSEGVRGSSGVAFSYAFNDFGCPPGFKKESLFDVRFFYDFRALRVRPAGGDGGRGGAP